MNSRRKSLKTQRGEWCWHLAGDTTKFTLQLVYLCTFRNSPPSPCIWSPALWQDSQQTRVLISSHVKHQYGLYATTFSHVQVRSSIWKLPSLSVQPRMKAQTFVYIPNSILIYQVLSSLKSPILYMCIHPLKEQHSRDIHYYISYFTDG